MCEDFRSVSEYEAEDWTEDHELTLSIKDWIQMQLILWELE